MSTELFSLADHTAVVTGCTRGIGQAIAVGLAEAGADLILIQARSLLPLPLPHLTNLQWPPPYYLTSHQR